MIAWAASYDIRSDGKARRSLFPTFLKDSYEQADLETIATSSDHLLLSVTIDSSVPIQLPPIRSQQQFRIKTESADVCATLNLAKRLRPDFIPYDAVIASRCPENDPEYAELCKVCEAEASHDEVFGWMIEGVKEAFGDSLFDSMYKWRYPRVRHEIVSSIERTLEWAFDEKIVLNTREDEGDGVFLGLVPKETGFQSREEFRKDPLFDIYPSVFHEGNLAMFGELDEKNFRLSVIWNCWGKALPSVPSLLGNWSKNEVTAGEIAALLCWDEESVKQAIEAGVPLEDVLV